MRVQLQNNLFCLLILIMVRFGWSIVLLSFELRFLLSNWNYGGLLYFNILNELNRLLNFMHRLWIFGWALYLDILRFVNLLIGNWPVLRELNLWFIFR